MDKARVAHFGFVVVASALQVAFLALGDATIALWVLVAAALCTHLCYVFACQRDEERRPQGQLAVGAINAALLAAALWQADALGNEAYGLVVAGAAAGLVACPVTVMLGVMQDAVAHSGLRTGVLKAFLHDMNISAALRTILFPLLVAGTALFLRTRTVKDPVALVAVILTALTGLLLLAPPAILVQIKHVPHSETLHRCFCFVYSITEALEIVATLVTVTFVWLAYPDYHEDSKSDLAAMGLLLSFAVVYIIVSCAIYAWLIVTTDAELRNYGSKFFKLYLPSMEDDDLWAEIASSPSLTILLQPVIYFLFASIPTTIALAESIEEPDECRAGRTALFVDFAAGTVAVGLLCITVAVETMRWKSGMIAMTVTSTLFTFGFLAFKCFMLWLYGHMTCEGRFHFDIRNVILANEYLYFLGLFIHVGIVSVAFAETAPGDWWAKFGINQRYFENYQVHTALKKVTEQTILWAIFHGLIVPFEAVAMAKCGADGIAPETWPYLQLDRTAGGGCKDIPWYPMSVMFSVVTMLLLLWTTISVRLQRPQILFNTGRSFHYYFLSDFVIHFMILGNLALAIGTLVVEPKNRGWGITFTITNTFRLVMVVVDILAEIVMFSNRHQALADALIEYFTAVANDNNNNPPPPTHRDDGATTNYEPPNMLDDFINFAIAQEIERTSDESRTDELRQRVLLKAKRGGQWLRRMRADGSVVWIAAEDLGESRPASATTSDHQFGHRRQSSNSSSEPSTTRRRSEHKSASEHDAELPPPMPLASKVSSFTPEQETNRLLGLFFCTVQPDATVVWQPGEKLTTVTDITHGLPREVATAHLAAVATFSFEDKCSWVRARLDSMRISWDHGHEDLFVTRGNLLNESVVAMNSIPSGRMRQIFRFHFQGEQGLDAGGVAREWFECVARELFEPKLGLFTFASTDNVSYQINTRATALLGEERCKELYYFTGRVMGKAMFDNHLLSAHLVRPLYKHLLGIPVGFHDLQFVDDQLYDSMSWALAEENVDQLELTFTTVELCADGKPHELELVPGGANMVVTNENKLDYVKASIKYRMFERQEFALGQILRGFFDVVPQGLISVFDAQELELMMCGFDDIDIRDWKANTLYEGTFSSNHKVVLWFWDILGKLSNQQRTRLLQYVTGTSRVPIGGFKQLQGVDGQVRRFTLRSLPLGEHEYPRSHTCFNRLDLPLYASKAHLESVVTHLTTVEIEGFSMD